ncbi:pollen receptor-like kinase 3 [Gossypium arboreum]|uniref:Protein kinase domain-containing protein n=1 Tax=Gossypium arboreum TaxID=29729 RepID=A0ABR0P713_GOSAR|nr:pollen receptor-like kinase 3 [Gossypium arboreum]KAK5814100.1 hypothetical protein PVK06_029552 [Gossypium arboreum]
MAAVRFIPLFFILFSTHCFSQSDEEALIKLKKSFIGGNLDNWVLGSGACEKKWVGVMCSGDNVTGLHLADMQLKGEVDIQALLQIRGLKAISLINNSFTGDIPDLHKLTNLRAIYLSKNKFSGSIPDNYFEKMGLLKKVWLDDNQFSGRIPDSLCRLPNLMELHLELNQFSGQIPPLKYPAMIRDLNLSKNNLEGEIPEGYMQFNASSFEGNPGLCGSILGKECENGDNKSGQKQESTSGSSEGIHGSSSGSNSKVLAISIGSVVAIVFLVIIVVLARKRKREDEFSILSKEPLKEEVLPVKVPEAESTTRRKPSESSRRSRSSKKGSSHGGSSGVTDLVMVNEEKGEFGMQDLMKAAAEVLGNGGLGSAYKAVMSNGLAVVVKRMKEMNRLGKEAFDVEMRRLGKLRHPSILTPLAYHFRREEKLIVSEYMPKGSLLYVLHGDRGIIHANLNWPTRLKIIKGIAQGLDFIHTEFATYEVPHGNLKSSNILLTENYDPLLSDFAFQPMANPNLINQGLFAYRSPEYVRSQQISAKSDVYCLGIVILEIITGKFPSQYLNNAKGGIDIVQWVQTSIANNQVEDLIDPEISNGSNSIDQMVKLLRIGAGCTESNPDKRLGMKEVIGKINEVNV